MIKIRFFYERDTLEIETDLPATGYYRASLRGMDLRYADLRGIDLHRFDLRMVDFRGADLRGANLNGADFRGADFRGANIDFSCWPLWTGSLDVKIDKRIFIQLLYHTLMAGKSVDDAEVQNLLKIPDIVKISNEFQHADVAATLEWLGKEVEK